MLVPVGWVLERPVPAGAARNHRALGAVRRLAAALRPTQCLGSDRGPGDEQLGVAGGCEVQQAGQPGLAANPAHLDLALTDAEEAAYTATAERIAATWNAGHAPATGRPLY